MCAKRNLTSAVAALILATAALFNSTTPAAAASLQGSAGFTTWGWVSCGTDWWPTEIVGSIFWKLNEVVLHGGVYWALTPVSAMVEINDPGLIRDDCRPYLMPRVFDLKNSSGAVVATNQTANDSLSYPGCIGYTYDVNYWSMSNGCHHAAYYFKLTHPAGYIYYGASVLPGDGLGLAGNTGWRSLGG